MALSTEQFIRKYGQKKKNRLDYLAETAKGYNSILERDTTNRLDTAKSDVYQIRSKEEMLDSSNNGLNRFDSGSPDLDLTSVQSRTGQTGVAGGGANRFYEQIGEPTFETSVEKDFSYRPISEYSLPKLNFGQEKVDYDAMSRDEKSDFLSQNTLPDLVNSAGRGVAGLWDRLGIGDAWNNRPETQGLGSQAMEYATERDYTRPQAQGLGSQAVEAGGNYRFTPERQLTDGLGSQAIKAGNVEFGSFSDYLRSKETGPSGLGSEALAAGGQGQAPGYKLPSVAPAEGLGTQAMRAGGIEPEVNPFDQIKQIGGNDRYTKTPDYLLEDPQINDTIAGEALSAGPNELSDRVLYYEAARKEREEHPYLSSFVEGFGTIAGAKNYMQEPFRDIIEEQRASEEAIASPFGVDIKPSDVAGGLGTATGMLGSYLLAGPVVKGLGIGNNIASPLGQELVREGARDLIARGVPNYLEGTGAGLSPMESLSELPKEMAFDAAFNAGLYGIGKGYKALQPPPPATAKELGEFNMIQDTLKQSPVETPADMVMRNQNRIQELGGRLGVDNEIVEPMARRVGVTPFESVPTPAKILDDIGYKETPVDDLAQTMEKYADEKSAWKANQGEDNFDAFLGKETGSIERPVVVKTIDLEDVVAGRAKYDGGTEDVIRSARRYKGKSDIDFRALDEGRSYDPLLETYGYRERVFDDKVLNKKYAKTAEFKNYPEFSNDQAYKIAKDIMGEDIAAIGTKSPGIQRLLNNMMDSTEPVTVRLNIGHKGEIMKSGVYERQYKNALNQLTALDILRESGVKKDALLKVNYYNGAETFQGSTNPVEILHFLRKNNPPNVKKMAEGIDPKTFAKKMDPIEVSVDGDGRGWISKGYGEYELAKELGVEDIPITVKYYDGSNQALKASRENGMNTMLEPENLAKMNYENTTGKEYNFLDDMDPQLKAIRNQEIKALPRDDAPKYMTGNQPTNAVEEIGAQVAKEMEEPVKIFDAPVEKVMEDNTFGLELTDSGKQIVDKINKHLDSLGVKDRFTREKMSRYFSARVGSDLEKEQLANIDDGIKRLFGGNGTTGLDRFLERTLGQELADPFVKKGQQMQSAYVSYRNKGIELALKITENVQTRRGYQAMTEYGEGLIHEGDLVKEFGREQAQEIIKASDAFRKMYDQYIAIYNDTIAPFWGLTPFSKRESYFHHYRGKRQGNLFDTINNVKLLSQGEDLSEEGIRAAFSNSPKGIMMEQKMDGMGVDALESMIDYINKFSYLMHAMPYAEDLAKLQTLAEGAGKKQFAEVLGYHIDSIRGAANDFMPYGIMPSNKALAKSFRTHKKTAFVFSMVQRGSALANASALLGKATTLAMQPFNNAQAIAHATTKHGVKPVAIGVLKTLGTAAEIVLNKMGLETGRGVARMNLYKESNLINVRRADEIMSKLAKGFSGKAMAKAGDLIEIFDTMSATNMWNIYYEAGLKEATEAGASKAIARRQAIEYADLWTRKAAAGRSIGDLPLKQQNKLFKLMAPFTLEMENTWRFAEDVAKDLGMSPRLPLYFATYSTLALMYDRMLGRAGLSPFTPIYDEYVEYIESGQEDPEKFFGEMGMLEKGNYLITEKLITQPLKDMGFWSDVAKREIGQALSNVPMGSAVGSLVPEFGIGEFRRKEFFGEDDPTRYGTLSTPFVGFTKNAIQAGFGAAETLGAYSDMREATSVEPQGYLQEKAYEENAQPKIDTFNEVASDTARTTLEAAFDITPFGGAVERAYEGAETAGLVPRVGNEYDYQKGYIMGDDTLAAMPDMTTKNTLRAMLLGTSNLDEVEEFFKSNTTPLSTKQTNNFFKLVNSDEPIIYNKTGKQILEERGATPAQIFDIIMKARQGNKPTKGEVRKELGEIGIVNPQVQDKIYQLMW